MGLARTNKVTPALTRGMPQLKKLERLRSGRMTLTQPDTMPEGHTPSLHDPVKWLPGFRGRYEEPLSKLAILSINDLLTHFPREYFPVRRLNALHVGEAAFTGGRIVSCTGGSNAGKGHGYGRGMRGRQRPMEVIIEAGDVQLKVPFFAPGLRQLMQTGRWLACIGTVDYSFGSYSLKVQHWDVHNEEPADLRRPEGALVPVYPLTANLRNNSLRALIQKGLKDYNNVVEAILPDVIQNDLRLMPVQEALRQIHQPQSQEHLEAARLALKFREFFLLEAGLALKHQEAAKADTDLVFDDSAEARTQCQSLFPFQFTGAQTRAADEILRDMCSPGRMHRLVQGDVGCGKTAVALYAMRFANLNGCQAAMLAPTEILARQHYQSLRAYGEAQGVRIALLVGGMDAIERQRLLSDLKRGAIDIVVGTHALLQPDVAFKKLGLVVFDEQHKFGVKQRTQLFRKGHRPHRLAMSATPIPRTLSMTVYGDLDLTLIDELPPGRKPVETQWLPETERKKTYAAIAKRLNAGDQVYFIEPLVENNPKLELTSAEERYRELQAVFGKSTVELLHGQLSQEEKERRMSRFARGEARVLVATVVVEVGVDVAQANVMVINHAERFGLSQLHQLRGRVGRAGGSANLYLFSDAANPESAERLSVLCKTNDGFEIAEADLRIRGFGDFIGTRQSGMPRLKLADPVADMALLKRARDVAFKHVDLLDRMTIRRNLQFAFGNSFDMVDG